MNKATIIRTLLILVPVIAGFFLLNSSFSSQFLGGITVIMGCLTGLWLLSLLIKDASIIDIFWGPGFVIAAAFYMYNLGVGELGLRNVVLMTMIALWGLRLGLYLANRNLGKGEDYRYVAWRKANGSNWWWLSFVRVFVMQGFLLWMISACLIPAFAVEGGLQVLDIVGMVLFGIGFFFEAVGDWQLSQFIKNRTSSEEVMDKGLWKYTRHPNYFGDALLWWGFFCFALAHPGGWMYIFSPILMTLLLMKVSGVAMLERKLKVSKPKYMAYMEKTSAFFPRMPKG